MNLKLSYPEASEDSFKKTVSFFSEFEFFLLGSSIPLGAFLPLLCPNLIMVLSHLFFLNNKSFYKPALVLAKFYIWSIDQTNTSSHF